MARDCLERVIETDTDYVDGLAWLAYLYGEEYHHRWNERTDEYDALDRAHEALRRVGLLEAAAKRPENLSGGMKKRCGVARAIVARPQVLLADDPFAGLDPVTERSIAELLLEVSEGRTLIVAVPDPVESLPVTRQVHFREGAVVETSGL